MVIVDYIEVYWHESVDQCAAAIDRKAYEMVTVELAAAVSPDLCRTLCQRAVFMVCR